MNRNTFPSRGGFLWDLWDWERKWDFLKKSGIKSQKNLMGLENSWISQKILKNLKDEKISKKEKKNINQRKKALQSIFCCVAFSEVSSRPEIFKEGLRRLYRLANPDFL